MDELKDIITQGNPMPIEKTPAPPIQGAQQIMNRNTTTKRRILRALTPTQQRIAMAAVLVPVLAAGGVAAHHLANQNNAGTVHIKPADAAPTSHSTDAPPASDKPTLKVGDTTVTFDDLEVFPGGVTAIIENFTSGPGIHDASIRFQTDSGPIYWGQWAVKEPSTSLDAIMSDGELTRISKSQGQHLPDPASSIKPSGWESLAAGKTPAAEDISYDLANPELGHMLVRYAAEELMSVYSPAATRKNVLQLLLKEDHKLETVEVDGEQKLKLYLPESIAVAGQQASAPQTPTAVIKPFESIDGHPWPTILIDPATGYAEDTSDPLASVSLLQVDEVPQELITMFNDAKAGKVKGAECEDLTDEVACFFRRDN